MPQADFETNLDVPLNQDVTISTMIVEPQAQYYPQTCAMQDHFGSESEVSNFQMTQEPQNIYEDFTIQTPTPLRTVRLPSFAEFLSQLS